MPMPGEPWRWPTLDDPTSGPLEIGKGGPYAHLAVDYDPDANLPRDEDGRVPAYYRCTEAEIEAFGLTAPPLRHRHNNWTPETMAQFVEALAATGTVEGACAVVHKSRMAAYRLRNRADATAFRAAWDEALRSVTAILADTAYERALEGTIEDVWYKGRKVGERRVFNDRLLMWLLTVRDPHGYAPVDQLDRAYRRRALGRDGDLARAHAAIGPAEEAWGLKLEAGGECPAVARLTAPVPGDPVPGDSVPNDPVSGNPGLGGAAPALDAAPEPAARLAAPAGRPPDPTPAAPRTRGVRKGPVV